MKKFTEYKKFEIKEENSLELLINSILKEDISIEVSNEKRIYDDLDIKISDTLHEKLSSYIDNIVKEEKIKLLESIKLSLYLKKDISDDISDEIENLKK